MFDLKLLRIEPVDNGLTADTLQIWSRVIMVIVEHHRRPRPHRSLRRLPVRREIRDIMPATNENQVGNADFCESRSQCRSRVALEEPNPRACSVETVEHALHSSGTRGELRPPQLLHALLEQIEPEVFDGRKR